MTGRRKLFLFLASSALAVALLTVPIVQVVEVEADGRVFVAGPGSGIIVSLEYLHSVELERVVETYEVSGCEIRLTRLTWPGHGSGLPSSPDDLVGPITAVSGGYAVENASLHLGRALSLSVKHRVSPRLTVNGNEVEVVGLVEIRACVVRPVAWFLWRWLGGSLAMVAES